MHCRVLGTLGEQGRPAKRPAGGTQLCAARAGPGCPCACARLPVRRSHCIWRIILGCCTSRASWSAQSASAAWLLRLQGMQPGGACSALLTERHDAMRTNAGASSKLTQAGLLPGRPPAGVRGTVPVKATCIWRTSYLTKSVTLARPPRSSACSACGRAPPALHGGMLDRRGHLSLRIILSCMLLACKKNGDQVLNASGQPTCQTMTSREQGRELVRMSVGCSASVASRGLVARAISPAR